VEVFPQALKIQLETCSMLFNAENLNFRSFHLVIETRISRRILYQVRNLENRNSLKV